MSITGMPRGSRVTQVIIAIVLIALGLYTLSKGWSVIPLGLVHFEGGPAKMASSGFALLGLGLICLQGMATFENKPTLYNLFLVAFYGAGGLGAVLVVLAFMKKAAGS